MRCSSFVFYLLSSFCRSREINDGATVTWWFIHPSIPHPSSSSISFSLSFSLFTDVFSLDSRLTRWWSIYVFSSSFWLGFHSTSLCNWRVYIKQPIDNDTSTFLTRFFFLSISISILSSSSSAAWYFISIAFCRLSSPELTMMSMSQSREEKREISDNRYI